MLPIKSNKLLNTHASPFFMCQYTPGHEMNEHKFYEMCERNGEDAVDLQLRSQAGGGVEADVINQIRRLLRAYRSLYSLHGPQTLTTTERGGHTNVTWIKTSRGQLIDRRIPLVTDMGSW